MLIFSLFQLTDMAVDVKNGATFSKNEEIISFDIDPLSGNLFTLTRNTKDDKVRLLQITSPTSPDDFKQALPSITAVEIVSISDFADELGEAADSPAFIGMFCFICLYRYSSLFSILYDKRNTQKNFNLPIPEFMVLCLYQNI